MESLSQATERIAIISALVHATEAHLMQCKRQIMKSVDVNYVLII